MPWRNTRDPYKILVSEVMLQQTQVSRVLPKYEAFIKAFPTTKHLTRAPEAKLLTLWSGLGYWRRARFLKETAKVIETQYKGKFPRDVSTLRTLPGVGPYTAGAVACFAFNNDEAFIDTNIRRVYLHFFFPEKQDVSDKEIHKIASKAVWKQDPREWHYALFDYGATVLKRTKINTQSRHYAKQSKFAGSFRAFRAKALQTVLQQPKSSINKDKLLDILDEELRAAEKDYSAQEIIDAVVKDKLIKESQSHYYL